MKIQRPLRGERGFTLVELLVVIVLAMILMAIAAPTLQTQLRQGKLRGAASQASTLLRLARLEAIKHSAQGIVYIVPATATEPGRMEAFADRDSDGVQDPEEPIVGRFVLPKGVDFVAPPDLEGAASVYRFTVDDDGGPNEAVFRGDGSILRDGAFRFGDERGNFVEVRVDPPATARVELRKCLVCTADDPDDWYPPSHNADHLGKAGEAWETWK
jgi:prepilin-type N-terminal cleavage/methylation domain-containing protein